MPANAQAHLPAWFRFASFIPAAWAVFIALYLRHIDVTPHEDNTMNNLVLAGSVVLNLLIAVPIRRVRLAATLLLFVFVVAFFVNFGAWYLPGLLAAIIVTAADWTRRRAVIWTLVLGCSLLVVSYCAVQWANYSGRGPVVVREGNFGDGVSTGIEYPAATEIPPPRGPVTPIPPGAVLVTICPPGPKACPGDTDNKPHRLTTQFKRDTPKKAGGK